MRERGVRECVRGRGYCSVVIVGPSVGPLVDHAVEICEDKGNTWILAKNPNGLSAKCSPKSYLNRITAPGPARLQAWPAGPQAWLDGPEGGMYGRRDGRT